MRWVGVACVPTGLLLWLAGPLLLSESGRLCALAIILGSALLMSGVAILGLWHRAPRRRYPWHLAPF